MNFLCIVDIVTVVCLIVGLIFFFGTAVGLLRFPDMFTRIHAASKGDTLSSFMMLSGFALYYFCHDPSIASFLVSAKLIFIMVFIFITSPTAGHALVEAAHMTGAKPWLRKDHVKEDEEIEE